MTVSMLRASTAIQRKEIDKLIDWLNDAAAARRRQPAVHAADRAGRAAPRALGAPVVVHAAGRGPVSRAARRAVAEQSHRADPRAGRTTSICSSRSATTTRGFMRRLPRHPAREDADGAARHQLQGLRLPDAVRAAPRARERARSGRSRRGPFTIGYFARVAPEKGLDAGRGLLRLRSERGLPPSRLEAAGYLAPEQQPYLAGVERALREAGLASEFRYHGALDRAEKVAFLARARRVLGAGALPRAEGLHLLEAMAAACRSCSRAHGAFPEIVQKTGGGLLVDARRCRRARRRDLAAVPGSRRARSRSAGTAAGEVRAQYSVQALGRAARGRAARGHELAARPPKRPDAAQLAAKRGAWRVLRVDASHQGFDGRLGQRPPPARLDVLRDVSLDAEAGRVGVDRRAPRAAARARCSTSSAGSSRRPAARSRSTASNPYTLDAKALAAFRNRRVGFVFQDHCLLPQCSVLENVLAPTLVPARRRTTLDRARTLLDRVGLVERLDHRPARAVGRREAARGDRARAGRAAGAAALRRADRQPRSRDGRERDRAAPRAARPAADDHWSSSRTTPSWPRAAAGSSALVDGQACA